MKEVNIKFDDANLKGQYSNFLLVQTSSEEFVLDFCNIFGPQPVHVSRMIISPGHMKRIVNLLTEQIEEYEKAHSRIKVTSEPRAKIGFDTSNNS